MAQCERVLVAVKQFIKALAVSDGPETGWQHETVNLPWKTKPETRSNINLLLLSSYLQKCWQMFAQFSNENFSMYNVVDEHLPFGS